MEKLFKFDSFINEKKVLFGTTDVFDKLSDYQQHFVLVVIGMLEYNGHMDVAISFPKNPEHKQDCILVMGGKDKNLDSPTEKEDPQSSKFLTRAIELVKGDKELSSRIEYKDGTNIVRIKK